MGLQGSGRGDQIGSLMALAPPVLPHRTQQGCQDFFPCALEPWNPRISSWEQVLGAVRPHLHIGWLCGLDTSGREDRATQGLYLDSTSACRGPTQQR